MQLLGVNPGPQGREELISGCADHKPAVLCGACALNTNALLPFSLLTQPLS